MLRAIKQNINHINYVDDMQYVTWPFGLPILLYILGLLIICTCLISLIPRSYEYTYIRWSALALSLVTFVNFCVLWYHFNYEVHGYQYAFEIPLIPEYNLVFACGLDGISMCFVLLTAFIIPICILCCGTIDDNYKQLVVNILLLEIFLLLSFCVTNLFFFFIFFESVLLPMYIIIGVWGARNRKINAAYYFFLYTLFGSFFLLLGVLFIFNRVESFDYKIIGQYVFSPGEQQILFLLFFFPFAIKIPMFSFHLWLPEAHVEAPTVGSVILAGLLLKLGGYGFLRFTLPMFPEACLYYQPPVMLLALMGVIYGSFCALRQSDLKKIIAYSSIAHMNLAVLGLFTFTHPGIDGAIYLMMGHGIVSAALFLCVGELYERYHTRGLQHYSGLVQVMPLFSIFFFVFTLSNMSFPASSNFVGEILIFMGLFEENTGVTFLAATGIILSAIYSIWLFNRICFGTLKNENENIEKYDDLNATGFGTFMLLLYAMLELGLSSECITKLTATPIWFILNNY